MRRRPRVAYGAIAAVAVGLLGSVGGRVTPAWAQAPDLEGEEDDSGVAGGDDAGDETGEDGKPKQPPVTSGGLFTKANYPTSELARPLTISKGMVEVRAGVGADVGSKTAFDSFSGLLEARYGVQDNFELSGQFVARKGLVRGGVAIEGSLAYDLLNVRIGAALSRSEITVAGDEGAEAAIRRAFEVELGFPLRYAFKPEFGVVALDTLLTFGDGKPDLTPSVAVVAQPVPVVAVILRAQMIIPKLDVDAEGFVVPATLAAQASAGHAFDVGLEFTFSNIKPPEGVKFYDQRELVFYVKARM